MRRGALVLLYVLGAGGGLVGLAAVGFWIAAPEYAVANPLAYACPLTLVIPFVAAIGILWDRRHKVWVADRVLYRRGFGSLKHVDLSAATVWLGLHSGTTLTLYARDRTGTLISLYLHTTLNRYGMHRSDWLVPAQTLLVLADALGPPSNQSPEDQARAVATADTLRQYAVGMSPFG